MASGIYNVFKSDALTKAISLTADTIKVALYNVSFAFVAGDTVYSTTNELPTANGYTQGGIALTTKTITGTTTVAWKADPSTWSASGAGLTAYFAVIYDTSNSNRLIACIDFGGAKTFAAGGIFTITWNSTTGILNLT